MRDVVVIGGGLSGLSACYELEKHNIRYTVIEVKPRFGGSIMSTTENGFTLDGGAFAVQDSGDWSLLDELGMDAPLIPFGEHALAFREGTESLINALTGKLTKGRLMRMAVSTIGWMDGRFTICMENGMMFDAGALIVAIPARYAERLFYTFVPEISQRLRNYHYDTILRVTLGYHKHDIPHPIVGEHIHQDVIYPFVLAMSHPARVPDAEHYLVQVGARFSPKSNPEHVIQETMDHFEWGQNPLIKRVSFWAEADPLSSKDDEHHDNMTAIRQALPDGISLIGSDYGEVHHAHIGVARIDDRIRQGREAAQQAIQFLKGKK